MISVVIVAGGSGLRMAAGTRKQYLLLGGRPVLLWTLDAILTSGVADAVILVVPGGDEAVCRELVTAPLGADERVRIVPGGEDRQASVFNGLKACPRDTRIAVIHDGVRPFVTREMLEACIDGAQRWGGAIAAVPPVDTLKQVDDRGRVTRTLDRSGVRMAQTPQAFRFPLILEAHERARSDGVRGTDDAQLVERIGGDVRVAAGSVRNIKLTRPVDLLLAEVFLELAVDADEGGADSGNPASRPPDH